MSVRVGIDLVTVADVADSLGRFGDRYLHRVYTATEIRDSSRSGRIDPARLAARFAAKEATVKVLRNDVPWTDIEVRRVSGGWLEVRLHRAAADVAARDRVGSVEVSVSHERDYAVAVASAEAGNGQPA